MHQTKSRITVTLEKGQAKSLRNVSKILGQPVSSLVRELIGESVQDFERLVIAQDLKGARDRVNQLMKQADESLTDVERFYGHR